MGWLVRTEKGTMIRAARYRWLGEPKAEVQAPPADWDFDATGVSALQPAMKSLKKAA
jgi:hypothetical protein